MISFILWYYFMGVIVAGAMDEADPMPVFEFIFTFLVWPLPAIIILRDAITVIDAIMDEKGLPEAEVGEQ